jgi:phosphoserine/homoserine phosphotransferase
MKMVCLDLEGVLVPEIWINVAAVTGIEALAKTTRDIADYDELMRYRLQILDQHQLRLKDIQSVIATMAPLSGALEFLDELRSQFQVTILSDTFYEFAQPLMRQLRWPLLMCHRLQVDADHRIIGYQLRQANPKRQAVLAFQSLYYQVLAAGDSYNDTQMLMAADAGAFIHAPETIAAQFPTLPSFHNYADLMTFFKAQ